MQSLIPFDPASTGLRIIDADPVITEHEDVLYMPVSPYVGFDGDLTWGLYDRNGRMIQAASYYRFPNRQRVGSCDHLADIPADADWAPSEHYAYAGQLTLHYGHFIVTSLARLWPFAGGLPAGTQLLWHTPHDPALFQTHAFAGRAVSGLDFGIEQFTHFTRPTRIKRVTVIAPAFEENHFAHRAFARLCRAIGDRLVPEWDRSPRPPAYLARNKMTWGVKGLANEAFLCEAVQMLGVELIHPEQLSLPDQIALFKSDRVIMGLSGSAFHTSIFAPPVPRLLAIEPLNSENQTLINMLNGNRMVCLRPDPPLPYNLGNPAFSTVFELPDPTGTARDLLRYAQAFA